MNIVIRLWILAILVGCSFEFRISETQDGESPIVKTNLGEIKGQSMTSRLGQKFLAFRGIRYAEAPVNELRFHPPVPVKPWNETYDATKDGPMCVQFTDDAEKISEDCLRLNIYTRTLTPTNKRPVIIYLHPGGFYQTSSRSDTTAGPEHLMDRDIVLVTLNYRLGILGFLSTGTSDAPGNNGLKDQVQAFKFVRDHIDKFGGDPKSVTLMGYSAGGMSITMHLVSPMSQGLFQRAIVMSGSATAQWDIPSDQMDLAKKQTQLLNCADQSIESIMDCLKRADKMDFAKTWEKMFEFAKNQPIILYKPVIERDFGQERFLTEHPTCLIKEGKFQQVDILTGLTQYEFVNPAINIFKSAELRQQMTTEFTTYAPICFLYERNTPKSNGATTKLQARYFNSTDNWLTFDGLKDLFADGVIGFGAHRFVQLASAHAKVYYYKFSYTGRYSHTYYPADKPYGAVHHDELLYLLRVPIMTPAFTKTDPENTIIDQLTGWFTNFAATGNPSEGEYNSTVKWEPTTASAPKYLEINDNPTMGTVPFPNRYDVWEKLFSIEDQCKSPTI